MVVDILGIASLCMLINIVSIVSVIFFALGTGCVCAVYELIAIKKIKMSKMFLFFLGSLTCIFYFTSVLGEMSNIWAIVFAMGIMFFWLAIIQKKVHKKFSIVAIILALLCSVVPWVIKLDVIRVVFFTIAFSGFELFTYIKIKEI